MSINWGSRWTAFERKSGRSVKVAGLVMAGLLGLYLGGIRHIELSRLHYMESRTGLATADRAEPIAYWQHGIARARTASRAVAGVVGGVPGGIAESKEGGLQAAALLSSEPSSPRPSTDASTDRKIVRTSSLELIVQHPAETTEKIRALAEAMGGFLVSSETHGGQDASSLTIRVPASRFEEARAEIRKLGLRIENEKIEAQDVTRQYVDQDASLRNLRAQETQYLAIMKRAYTVKETLEVSEKLSEVRGQIEQQQAEFDALSKQIETVAITISLRAEAEAQVFGLHWRPLYQLKLALRDGLDGIADYGVAMTSVVFYLPTVLLWLGTILLGAALGWRILRWAGRRLFGWHSAPQTVPQQG
jgi:hypothetical protein